MSSKTAGCEKLSWFSKDIVDSNYLRRLTEKEKRLISDVISMEEDTTITYSEVNNRNPVLRDLNPLFEEINHKLINAQGFIIIEGFPTDAGIKSVGKIKKFFLNFCLYLGKPLRQNRNHDIIFDVKSIKGENLHTKDFRGPYIKDALPMHTDAGAILGMYCLSSSELGGDTLLASARVVHDEIKRLRPDLLDILYKPFYVDRRNQEPEDALPYDMSPIFAMHGNELVCQYHQPFYHDVHKKDKNIAPLSATQLEALNLFDEISMREDIAFKTKLHSGSVIFINNERILHGRTSFDFIESEDTRYLLRIWLNSEKIKYTFPNFMGYL